MLAEVSESTGPEEGVGDGVGKDVAVGGGGDTDRFGDHDPTQPEGRVTVESVDVETPADPGGRLPRAHSSSGSTLGRARSSFLTASSSSTSRLNASSELRVRRALESIRLRAGLIPLVCWA